MSAFKDATLMINVQKEKCPNNIKRTYVDVCRGLAIFLMLWGHCIQLTSSSDFFQNIAFRTIYSFHMPLFMLISGYLFKFSFQKRDIKTLMVHKVQSMIQPIIMCSVLYFFAVPCLNEIIQTGNIRILFDSGWDNYLYVFWFLWSVLAANITVIIACKNNLPRIVKLLLLIVGTLFVALFPNKENNIYMYPYFIAGFLFAKFKNRMPKWILKLKYLSFVLFPFMLLFFDKKHYIYTSGILGGDALLVSIKIDVFRWIIGFLGSIFVLTFVELLFILLGSRLEKSKVIYGIKYLGCKSLHYYVLSVVFLSGYLNHIWDKLLNISFVSSISGNYGLMTFVITPIIAIAYCFGIWLIIIILEKLKISRILFGR